MAAPAPPTPGSEPVSFMDALKQRYGADDDSALGFGLVQDKKWQFVGAAQATKKQSQYDKLGLVVLRSCGITCAFHSDESADENAVKEANMARLVELDLSENTTLTLGEVGRLLPFFPRLATLQLCDIPTLLAPPSMQSLPTQHVAPLLMAPHLSKLVLNNTGFTTLAQLRALVAVPALQELHLDANKLRCLAIAHDSDDVASVASAITFPRVTTLSLAHNELSDWTAIGAAVTQAFPALTQLYLTDNKLNDVKLSESFIARAAAGVPRTEEDEKEALPYQFLAPLTLLCLKDNATLADPSTVDAVRVLCPNLETFRITYSTLLPTWNETNSRMYVVAALPTITLLNRGTVRAKERLDSELLYVQRGLLQRARQQEEEEKEKGATNNLDGTASVETEGQQPQPASTLSYVPYPLVDVLREKHKDVVLSIQREGDTASMTGVSYLMLNVTLYFVNGYAASTTTSTSSPMSKQTQKLPSSLTVAKLKALVHKLFQVKPMHQRLSYRSGDHGVLETQTPLDNEQETLGYYGVPDGGIIYVEDSSLRN